MKKNNFSSRKFILKKKFRVAKNEELYQSKFSFFNKLLFLRKRIFISNSSFAIKKTPWLIVLFSILIFILSIVAFNKMEFTFIEDAMSYLNRTLGQIFAFKNIDPDLDESILATSFSTILDTIKISIFGTFIGLVLSIPTGFLSARNLTKKWYINKPVRMIMALARTVPPIVLALILSLGFNGWTAATIVLTTTTWAGMNKILYEEIESIDMRSYYSMISMGYTRFSAFRETILRKIMNKFVEMGLYHFEISIRISAILGVVGGIAGIGGLIRQYSLNAKYWAHLAIPIFMIFGTIIIIEFISTLVRVMILEKKTNPFDEKELSSFTNKKTYLLNQVNKKTNERMQKTRFSFLKVIFNTKRKIKVFFINRIKYKEIDRKSLNLMASNKIVKIKNKFERKIKVYQKLVSNKIKNKEKYNLIIDGYRKQQDKEIARVISLSQAKDRVFFVKQSKLPNFLAIFISFLFIFLFIWSSFSIKFGMLENSVIGIWLSNIFNIDWDLMGSSSAITGVFPLLFEALLLALVATIIGGFFAFIFGALASKNVTSHFSYFFQVFILLIRSFPPFLVAVIIAPMFKGGISIVGALSLGLYSVGMLGKLIKSQFDQIDHGPVTAIRASGGTSLDAFRMGVLPQVVPNIVSVIIYRWELNLKQTITVGIVGASQFGKRYYYTFSHNLYSSAFTYLWAIVTLVIILEFFSNIVRKYIVEGSLPTWVNKIIKFIFKNSILMKQLFLIQRGFNIKEISKSYVEAYYKSEKLAMSSLNSNLNDKDIMKVYSKNKKYFELKINHIIKKNADIKIIKKLKNEIREDIKRITPNINFKEFINFKKIYLKELWKIKKNINTKVKSLKLKKINQLKEYKNKISPTSSIRKVFNIFTFNQFIDETQREQLEYLKQIKKTSLIKYI